jgi:penicillin-binding protein 1A
LLLFPHILCAELFFKFNFWRLREDADKCIAHIDALGPEIPDRAVGYLIFAEDHRNAYHPGVDPIAIFRALFVRLTKQKKEGASTIEQQYVRVMTGRFQKTLARKLREQLLALIVSSRRPKTKIAKAYLSVGFYGTSVIGLAGFARTLSVSVSELSDIDIMQAVARLKYPQPRAGSTRWKRKIERRVAYIDGRRKRYAVNPTV